METKVVFVLQTSSEKIVRIFMNEDEANGIRDQYNRVPFVAGHPDVDSPYEVARWEVT